VSKHLNVRCSGDEIAMSFKPFCEVGRVSAHAGCVVSEWLRERKSAGWCAGMEGVVDCRTECVRVVILSDPVWVSLLDGSGRAWQGGSWVMSQCDSSESWEGGSGVG
jgi:hypothetical protein